MDLIIDPDVKAVAEFMQRSLPPDRLAAVASGLAKLGPILWEQYGNDQVQVLRLAERPILACDPHTQSCASGSCPAH